MNKTLSWKALLLATLIVFIVSKLLGGALGDVLMLLVYIFGALTIVSLLGKKKSH
jgi:hypothetical protein